MQVVGSTGVGGESNSAANVVRVAVGVNHRFDRETRAASQVQARMEVAERIDHDGLPRARDNVA